MSPVLGARMSRKEGGSGGMNASYIVYGIIGFMYIFVLGFLGYFMSTRLVRIPSFTSLIGRFILLWSLIG